MKLKNKKIKQLIFYLNQSGEEKIRIEKVGASIAPVWGVDFSQTKDDSFVIATVDWTQCLTFYDNSGNQVNLVSILTMNYS